MVSSSNGRAVRSFGLLLLKFLIRCLQQNLTLAVVVSINCLILAIAAMVSNHKTKSYHCSGLLFTRREKYVIVKLLETSV